MTLWIYLDSGCCFLTASKPFPTSGLLENSKGCFREIALLYGDEWPQVKVKDMTTGEQTLISKNDVISRMEPLLR